MTATLDSIAVRTYGGHTALFDVRPDTNDAALAFGIIGGDEYPFERMQGISGWAIDIGAHIGIVTVALALDNPDLRIVAVEALEPNAALLWANVRRNGLEDRVTVLHGAASTEAEREEMTRIDITYGWTSAQNQPDGFMRDSRYIGGMVGANDTSLSESCMPESLSSIIDYAGEKAGQPVEDIALVKIDCEGCEWYFLTSPELHRVKRIIGELHHGKNGGAAEFRALLEPLFTVEMDDAKNVAIFEAVRRG